MDSSTTNASVELIPGMDKLLEYMKNQDKKIKELQEENKKQKQEHIKSLENLLREVKELKELQEQNKKLKEDITNHPDFEEIATDWYERHNWMVDKDEFTELKEENKKLEEEIKKLKKAQEVPDGVIQAFRGLTSNWWEDEKQYYEENFDIKEKYDEEPDEIPTKYLNNCNYTDLRILDDWLLKGKYEKYEMESDEETDKYDGDDWRWVYGKMIVKNDDGFDDVVLCMAGGGDHWENWIMRPSMNYIENKDGLHFQRGKVLIQSSCGNYVSFQDKDYECDEDECICQYENCLV